MLNLRYDSEAAVDGRPHRRVHAHRRLPRLDRAGQGEGAFPLFDADGYLKAGSFANRLPEDIKKAIRKHGIRNSHLLSIAPTGTVSLAFADNASNGIEPAFSWTYTRKKRRPTAAAASTRCRTMPGARRSSAATRSSCPRASSTRSR